MKKPSRILSVSDFHCGNIAGLTPHEFNPQSDVNYKMFVYRRALWDWFLAEVKSLGPIDILVVNGDAIDGKAPKNGGNELIYPDRTHQIDMATAVVEAIGAKEVHFTYGTGYHVGPEDDWETEIARNFGADIQDVLSLEPNGLRMKWRHHIGASTSPVGRGTPLARHHIWDMLWSLDGEFERADVFTFGHVHYYTVYADRFGTMLTSPALQGLGGSQLGSRRMGGIVDFGFIHFDVSEEGWSWHPHILPQTRAVRAGQVPAASTVSRKSKSTSRRN